MNTVLPLWTRARERLSKLPAQALLPLALAGLALEGCWIVIAALTAPLTHSTAYLAAWTPATPLGQAFASLAPRLAALAPATFGSRFDHGASFACFLAALIVGSGGYLIAIRAAYGAASASPRAATLLIVAFALVFQLTLWCMPGILTTDLASYAMYGRISTVYSANPFSVAPADFPDDPLLPWIATSWWSATSIYGPLWLDVSWLVARMTAALPVISQVMAYRALINVGYLATLGVMYWLLGRVLPSSRLPTFLAVAWSPLLLLQIAANGHNDGAGVLLLLVGFACLGLSVRVRGTNWAWAAALLLFLLAALVKFLSVFAIVFCAVAWWRLLPTPRQKLSWLGGTGLLLALVTLLVDAPWLPEPFLSVQSSGRFTDIYAHSLIDVPATWLGAHVLDRAGQSVQAARQTARTIFLVPAIGAFLVLFAFEIRRVWRGAQRDAPLETVRIIVGATTRTLLAFVVLASTQVHHWYFAWPIVIGLVLGWRDMAARVAVAYGLLFTLVAYLREDTGQPPLDPLLIAYALLPLALPAFFWARRRWLASDRLSEVRTAVETDRVRV